MICGVVQEHGGFAEDDRNVALLAAGPAFSAGAVDTAAVQTVQVRCLTLLNHTTRLCCSAP